jgi:hypothetical protein
MITFLFAGISLADNITYSDSWANEGITLQHQDMNSVKISYSIASWSANNTQINGSTMQEITLAGYLLPNNEGAPNLPGTGRYIAVPEGATANLNILDFRTEVYEGIEVAPAPRIPWDTENGPLEYAKNNDIYTKDAFYPETPFVLSEPTEIRGVDAVMLGITPFQYNPVTKTLKVFRDIQFEVTFEGGIGTFGEDRLRSRWWDPIFSDIFLNSASLPEMDYNKSFQQTKESGCEYLIITPTNPEFLAWADSIKQFRTLQGISTDIVTLDDIGGNNSNYIQIFVNNAYNNWEIVPSAVLLLGDYGTNATNSIISPIWDYYCVSDNIYADVTGNSMPDIIFARITAANEQQLEVMVTKFLNYERTPPTNPAFYDHPITALGWQTERWFQICSETIGGYMKNVKGKNPVRINEIYEGNPDSDPWSTATNTGAVMGVFGPNGLGYIPASPTELGDWEDGDAEMVNEAINNGAFMLQHRDHGFEQGWGEPDYTSPDISGLTNTDLTFVFSVNCLTGKYNLGGTCFTEVFHRYTHNGQNSGALGLIAASEVSYSFVNDAYVWGMYDNLWPDFLPQYGSEVEYRGVMPAFGNAAGKYFLQQSSWPYNEGNKEVTYNLFHHHGDAFLTIYSEVPQPLTVIHNQQLLEGITSFEIMADENALIAFTVNGEIIATASGTGEPMDIIIPAQSEGSQMVVTVTKQNYFRYQSVVEVISSNVAYVVKDDYEMNEVSGNGNGLMDYGETITLSVSMENIGTVLAENVVVTLSTENEFINITDGTESFGNIDPGSAVSMEDCFQFSVDYLIPDNQNVLFEIAATDGTDTWVSEIVIKSHAPVLEFLGFEISDPSGNNNGRIDPGETVDIIITIENSGSSDAMDVTGDLLSSDPYITLNTNTQTYGVLSAGSQMFKSYSVTADGATPEGHQIDYAFEISAEGGISYNEAFYTVVGKFTALVLDLDPQNYSGPGIYETFENMDVTAVYETSFPEDLGIYKNIFVTLGLHYQNYELTQDQGQLLKDYLLEGGNIYLEGRVTWKSDPQTAVHPMFNIEVVDYSMFVISEVLGVDGSFTSGMTFGYDGVNPVNNYSIEPIGTAFSIFTTNNPDHGCGVAYNEGSYRTIGTTIEFGKLVEGVPPSTRMELMQRYLNWFDGTLTSIKNLKNGFGSDSEIQIVPNPFQGQTSLNFTLKQEADVTLTIYNMQGEQVKSIYKNTKLNQGNHRMSWDGTNDQGEKLASGLYFATLLTKDINTTEKIILSK